MAVTEHGRFVLYQHFEDTMGEEKAEILMDHLLPVGWTDLATTHDVQVVQQDIHVLKQDVHVLKQDVHVLKQDVHVLKQEVADIRATMATKQDLAHLREIMATKVEVAEVRMEIRDLKAEMYKGFRTQTLALVGLMVTLQGLTVATLRMI